ncbi:hypothetical protein DespoDRAFT_01461 [Desulfobacter postgatei 2ac9]|uniref:Uncharacterized protein n=1 Tax=Desulfobacter postgatei 2ac9 TaxID=879212 RepID=I5B1P2_9BACT|nr:hypothetical protein DespoDRAFT_01461 [Desulfobacter postgatei 2ac9]
MKLAHVFGDRFGRCRNEKATTTEVMRAFLKPAILGSK